LALVGCHKVQRGLDLSARLLLIPSVEGLEFDDLPPYWLLSGFQNWFLSKSCLQKTGTQH